MKKKFSIDARTILALGRDSIKDHTTALLELVKNSYDADATKVTIDIICKQNKRFIKISDNGCGMSENELDNNWLRIGYSEKRSNKISKLKRRKTGEKGIGRLSADRLGSTLTLITKSKNKNALGIQINWDNFNVEGKDLSTIPIMTINRPKINIPKSNGRKHNSGTELIISNLRQKWVKNDIKNLYNELSILTPPFKQVQDYEIYLETDIDNDFNGKIVSPFFEKAEVELSAKFDGQDTHYVIKDKYTKKKFYRKHKIGWKNLLQKSSVEESNKTDEEYPEFGSVKLELLFYPREASILEGTDFRLSDLREFLNKNAGIKIYRDNIRVKPYGNPVDPQGDWLGLAERKTREPAGIMRPTWKVAANQIVGAVFVGRDKNPNLVDSASREGLIHEEAFKDLRAFVLGCLRLLETHRHEIFREKVAEPTDTISATEEINDFNKELNVLKSGLSNIMSHTEDVSDKLVLRAIDQVDVVTDKIKETQKSLDELVSQSRVFRGLSTIGIASAVFGHETESSISGFISATYTASSILAKKPSKIKEALDEIEKAKKYADQVSAWGAFALGRVQRDKRRKRKHNIANIIVNTINDIKSVFDASSIEIKTRLNQVELRSYAMDIEAILLNLMTNAYTACQQIKRKRIIRIELKQKKVKGNKGFEIIVADSGTGIHKKFLPRIWEPLFTTKVDKDGKEIGTGLGLTIVNSILNDLKGIKHVDSDPRLNGARFNIWIPEG